MKISSNSLCPCGSGDKYKKCCQPFHKGIYPKTALALMRSRYSAFFLSLPKYIIKTTHKDNVDYTQDITQWENDIVYFTQNFNFEKLTIIDHIPGNTISFVTFKAQISSHGKDETFCEKSKFERINNRWLYLSGEQIIKA